MTLAFFAQSFMKTSRHFVRGLVAPFSMPWFFPAYPKEPREADPQSAKTGFERDAENIRGYWTNLGNYMIDISNGQQQKPANDRISD